MKLHNKQKPTTVIEVAGGPGAGKSVEVAEMYSELKKRKLPRDVEMAREYIKRHVYEGNTIGPLDELYILGNQIREESRLLGHVDVVVSDRPVLLSAVFGMLYAPAEMRDALAAAVRGYYHTSRSMGHRRVLVLLPRRFGYVETGRWESARGAARADAIVEQVVGEVASTVGLDGLYRFGCEGVGVADVVVDVDRMVRST